ncbi:hypothetical protein [Pseudomonas phage PPpW-3]|uniref:Uncharacterized protein n=1 Tax=Pseudomonas phage PPpW-3 TaxID=1279082 RepID=V5YST2_9CAUD|nr:hypothetical protein X916_gp10 [Pseudomonas phage PPpW-3]BAO20610.1 hypothetical protein [Pseudomonas phage PPpW-3]
MTNANTEVDLGVLHAAIVADIKDAFPGLETVEFYREDDRKTLPKPACLLELSDLEPIPDDDPGTEQLAVMAKFEAELVIGFRTPEAKLSIRLLAASFGAWLRMRRWTNYSGTTPKLPTGEAQVIGIYQDDFNIYGRDSDKGLSQYEVWKVEWQQRIHLGKTVWTDEGVTPAEVYVQGHIGGNPGDGYEQVVPE